MEEWHRLDESLDDIIAGLRPGSSQIVVVEDKGEIVGHLMLFPVLHAECLWIAPAYRKRASVLRWLLAGMKSGAKALGFDRVWGSSVSDEMTKILAHPKLRGIVLPSLSVVLPVEGK